ncbi:MAG TPA: MarR family transcriptional regulator [Candidatus Limnocylindria bacterium]|nr:MarR family transcriptional regulator [Candidatus Limnocylindria bacterium]
MAGTWQCRRAPRTADVDPRILDALVGAPADPDALARRLGMSAAALSSRIARLVVRGEVMVAPDGRFARR